jgi:hypothetical protein
MCPAGDGEVSPFGGYTVDAGVVWHSPCHDAVVGETPNEPVLDPDSDVVHHGSLETWTWEVKQGGRTVRSFLGARSHTLGVALSQTEAPTLETPCEVFLNGRKWGSFPGGGSVGTRYTDGRSFEYRGD